jgi:hypothetical protein
MPQAANTSEPKEGQHRLTDMLVEEVSFVDRGANKKRFLIVKRRGPMATAAGELVPDGRGGMRRVSTRKAGGDEEETDEEKAKKAKKPPFGGNKAPPFGKKPKEGDDEEETEKAGDEEEEEETEKANDGEEEETDEAFEDGKKKKAAGKTTKADVRKAVLATVTQAIELLMDAAEDLKDGGEDDDEEGDYSPPAAVTANAKKALGLLAKMLGADTVKGILGKAFEAAGELAQKAGRRMSKERLDRFTKALGDLQSILKEVMSSPELKDDTEKRGAALLKALAKVAKASTTGGADDGRVDQLLEAVTELTETVQEQAATIGKLEKRNEVLRKGAGGLSNQAGVETRETGTGGGDGDVEWPFDLNRPIDKAHTDKDTSFYDD